MNKRRHPLQARLEGVVERAAVPMPQVQFKEYPFFSGPNLEGIAWDGFRNFAGAVP